MENKIIIKNLCKSFSKQFVLEGISFDIIEREFVSIVGPSGCGKTTLLYLIQGFIGKTKGEIQVNGKKGFVFQDHNLFPWKTVRENIAVGPLNEGKDKESVMGVVDNFLEDFNLTGFGDYYPNQISEGMKQRVGIARCLINHPEILLMDEPFGSLDYLTRLKMQDFLLDLKKKNNLTILFITHDIDEAIKMSDKIIVLSDRPAKIKEIIAVKNEVQPSLKNKILRLIQ